MLPLKPTLANPSSAATGSGRGIGGDAGDGVGVVSKGSKGKRPKLWEKGYKELTSVFHLRKVTKCVVEDLHMALRIWGSGATAKGNNKLFWAHNKPPKSLIP